MKVKRYVVDDLPQAVQMIRSELGSDAVILNTKEIRIGGFLGMFRKKRVEVIAAVDEASRKMPARPQPARPAKPAAPDNKPPASVTDDLPELRTPIPNQAVRSKYAAGSGASAPAAPAGVAIAEQAVEYKPLLDETPLPGMVEAVHPSQGQTGGEAPASENTLTLLQELRTMKDMMAKLTRQQTFRSMPESVVKWSRRLAEQGVDPVHVEQFAEEVRHRLGDEDKSDESASYEAAKEVLTSWLLPCAGSGISPGIRIAHFVGPTGVGKTTTIAKLAAEQSLNHRRSVGLITADTYRISAVDQLRTYADILNVPLEVVFSPGELTRAYKKMADRDLLFMDTAGRNYRNEMFVSEVNSLLAPGEKSETFLVLSMTHKYADMKLVAAQFAKYGVRRLLITKTDETDTFGAIVNLVREFSFPISYITCGQTVPDDIRPFDPAEWVNKLLGEPAHE
ncbi:flagellar biosynthesis protein FlhF [Cohnella pontilimi]|uniref:Flagellar biosynthesis protein FlhF n=1 Tax=Cohnella pontilimi TaxID=2564100 RepID=A0A4U0FE10_9BACL|nr:flagellar biosynthesis protein FlhF [Cohnella pontilimi]TJY43173.1 flagellar biosynthesis protein FlhF [Cohnella pontilimi]